MSGPPDELWAFFDRGIYHARVYPVQQIETEEGEEPQPIPGQVQYLRATPELLALIEAAEALATEQLNAEQWVIASDNLQGAAIRAFARKEPT